MEKIDRDDLFVWDDRTTKGNEKNLKRITCKRGIKKYSFSYRSIEAWNKLDAEVTNARNIHDFKSKLDNSRFGDGPLRPKPFSCIIQQVKYTLLGSSVVTSLGRLGFASGSWCKVLTDDQAVTVLLEHEYKVCNE